MFDIKENIVFESVREDFKVVFERDPAVRSVWGNHILLPWLSRHDLLSYGARIVDS